MEQVSEARCWGGYQRTYRHESESCGCPMQFAVYLPPAAQGGSVPAVYWLSGLTCSEENFSTKAGAQRYAAELGIALIVPDTSPRNFQQLEKSDEIHLGEGAGFYVDATEDLWRPHYQMFSYITQDLVEAVNENLPVDGSRKSICGHSMGGHGALTIGMKEPEAYRCVSALAPISSAPRSGWGEAALTAYLGPEKDAWNEYDAAWLIANRPNDHHLLIDQGSADPFLDQLMPDALTEAAERSGQSLELNLRSGYDHSYYFVASFIGDHLRQHAAALNR